MQDQRASAPVRTERHGAVTRVVLDRPRTLNAIGPDMVDDLTRILGEVQEDPSVRALVLTGAGTAFCAGSDVKAMGRRQWRGELDGPQLQEHRRSERRRMTTAFATVVRLAELPMPTVAALRGAVAGGGLALASACDLRVASTTVRASTAYARLGLPGDWGLTRLLPELVGRQTARRLMLHGTPLDADAALEAGLVDEVVDDGELDTHALELAADLARGPTRAYAEMKALLRPPGLREQIEAEVAATLRAQETHDHREGLRSLLDRREPNFQGS